MTRRRKFELGDLVVLKKSVKVDTFPSLVGYYSNTTDKQRILNEISNRSNINSVVRRTRAYQPSIRAGTVGLIRGFGNVFMLEYDKISKEVFESLSYARKQDALRIGSEILLNRSARMHMHVLIDERLVAFAPGAKLFEKADDALSRYESVVVKFEGSMVLERVNEIELKERLQGKLRHLKSALDVTKVISIECQHRDGTIETKEVPDGTTVH